MEVVPCQYFPSPSPSLQPISPSLSSHISSVSIPHLHRTHPYCPASTPPFLSAAVFTADLVCHPYLPCICSGPYHIILHRSMYFAAVVCLPSPFGFSPCSASFCTSLLALLCYTLIFSLSALILSQQFSLLSWQGYSLSPLCYCSAMIYHVFKPPAFTLLCSNLIINFSSVCSNMISPSLTFSTMIYLLILLSSCSNMLGSYLSDLLCL